MSNTYRPNGKYRLVTPEEVAAACVDDKYFQEVVVRIEEAKVDVLAKKFEISNMSKLLRKENSRLVAMIAKINNLKSQLRHLENKVRERVEWKKIEETREQIGID